MQKKILLFSALFFFLGAKVQANFKIDSLSFTLESNLSSGTQVILGYYLGERTFRKGIIDIGENGGGTLRCQGHEGLYFLVFPDTSMYEFLVAGGNNYSLKINFAEGKYHTTLSAGKESMAYASYKSETNDLSSKMNELRKSKSESNSPDEKSDINAELFRLKYDMDSLTKSYATAYAGTLFGELLKARQPVTIPKFSVPGNASNSDSLRWMMGIQYFRHHYLDNITWSDRRLIYTPVFADKINIYLDRIVAQKPDSLLSAIDEIMSRTSDTIFHNFLNEFFLRKYERTKYKPVPEFVFAHVAQRFLNEESNVPAEERQKIERELDRIRPALLENIAPDITLPGKDQKMYSLHDVIADHILLIFWQPGCSICTNVIGQLIPLLSKYNYLSIRVYTVSTDQNVQEWSENTIGKFPKSWVNVYETAGNQPSELYNIAYTPSLFLLDSDRRIIAKYFTVAQLDDLLFQIATTKK